jgi:hypothetical protein
MGGGHAFGNDPSLVLTFEPAGHNRSSGHDVRPEAAIRSRWPCHRKARATSTDLRRPPNEGSSLMAAAYCVGAAVIGVGVVMIVDDDVPLIAAFSA